MCNGVVEGFDPASEFLQVGKRESLQQADDAPQQEQLRGILDHQHARQHEQITHGLRLCRKGEKCHTVPEPHDVVILRQTRRALAFALLGRGREDGVVIERGRQQPATTSPSAANGSMRSISLRLSGAWMNDPSLRLSASIFSAVPGVHPGSGAIFNGVMVSGLHWWMGIFLPCCNCLRLPGGYSGGISERDDRAALAEIIDAVDPDAAAVVCDEDLFTPRGAPPCGMGVCDEKIPVHVVDRPVVLLGQFPEQCVDPLRRQHRFSPTEEKPAVLETEEDESHRGTNGRDPEKRPCRNGRHTREGDDDHEER